MTTLTVHGKRLLARAVGELRPLLIDTVRSAREHGAGAQTAGRERLGEQERERALRGAAAALLYRQIFRRQIESLAARARLPEVTDELAQALLVAPEEPSRLEPFVDLAAADRLIDSRLARPELEPLWCDPTALGWAYQYWNDVDRQAVDARLEAQEKLEPWEIATKTQIFTERYMVEWLLANSLGHCWLGICERHGWRAEANARLERLATARAARRGPSEAAAAMAGDAIAGAGAGDDAWSFYVPRPIVTSAVARPLASVGELRLLDPACGTGHFLVAAFDMLFAMHREEARHRGLERSDAEIARAIVEHNLFGVEIDDRAARVAVAALTLQCLAHGAEASSVRPNVIVVADALGVLRRDAATLRPTSFDLVVGNPPYFGTQSLADSSTLDREYPESKENLCTAMIDRSLELVVPGGCIAFVTARSWLYVSQLARFRRRLLESCPPVVAADLGPGGFETLPGVDVVLWVAESAMRGPCRVIAADEARPEDKEALLRCPAAIYETDPAALARLPGSPFAYRWSRAELGDYLSQPLVGSVAPVRVGMKTSDNLRFVRRPWELPAAASRAAVMAPREGRYAPYVKGAAGKAWIEPLTDLVDWRDEGLAIRVALAAAYRSRPQGEAYFFAPAVAFSTIGRRFLARAHRYPSIFDVAGSSVVTDEVAAMVCLLNSGRARRIVEALNPTVNFQVGDVARIPLRRDPEASRIFGELERAFEGHEATDERSFRFAAPGPSSWRAVQRWAQASVDRPEGEPLADFEAEWDPPDAESLVSHAVGVALGRFGASGEGWLSEASGSALEAGILYLSATGHDSLDEPACALLRETWRADGAALGGELGLRDWLRRSFAEVHRRRYEGRPIYLPLASARRSFVAHVSVHRFDPQTLSVLRHRYLEPDRALLAAELDELRRAYTSASSRRGSSKRLAALERLLAELDEFIGLLAEVAGRGPPGVEPRDPAREVDACFAMVLEDGVLVNASALWPLCLPLWQEPRRAWQQLARRRGPKGCHFDWSATAARYFPGRVAAACERDPVVATAHGRLWACHPAHAYRFEQELRRSVRSDFAIDEPGADEHRQRLLAQRPAEARAVETSVGPRAPAGARAVTGGGPRAGQAGVDERGAGPRSSGGRRRRPGTLF